MIRRIATVGGLHAYLPRHGLPARRGHGRGAGRRPHGRRLLHRLQAPQPFPRHPGRGRLQRGLRAGLCAHAGAIRARRRRGSSPTASPRRLLAINIVLLGLALVFTPSVVGLLAPGLDQDDRALRSRRDAHPHHLPLAAARVDADHDLGRAQRQWPVRRGGRRADPAQYLHGRDAERRLLVSQCRAMPPPGACSSPAWRKCCWWASMPSGSASASDFAPLASTCARANSSALSVPPSSAPAACSLRSSPTR